MQRVRAVIDGQLVFLAVERELAPGDPVGDAARGGPEMGMAGQVGRQIVKAKDDVGRSFPFRSGTIAR